MTELASTAAEPTYIQRLGLTGLPFKGVNEANFYVSKSVRHNSLLATHLLRTTRYPVVLTGEAGIGKSACLAYVLRQAHDDLRFCRLDITTSSLVSDSILSEALGLNVDSSETAEARTQYLQQRLSQLRQLNQIPVLVVDDLDQCSPEIQAQIEKWLSWHDEAGQPLIQMLATANKLPEWLVVDAQSLPLSGLLENEQAAYLNHRLQSAAYQGDTLFSDKALTKFFRQSQGHPERLNQLAHQALLSQKHGTPSVWSAILQKHYRQIIPITLMSLVALIVLIYQDQINAWFSEPTSTEQTSTDIVLPLPDEDIAPVVVGEEGHSEAIAELEALLESMPEYGDTSVLEEAEPFEKAIEPVVVADTVDEQNIEPLVHDVDWIMAQATTHYTFQLMGSWDEQEVKDFIKEHVLEGDVAHFISTRQGQPWYVLIYGLYPNKEAALQASEAWPTELAALPTWLRRIDSVQKQIKAQTILSE